MIKGVHHTAISTGNLERLSRFYSEVLGFEVVMEGSWESGSDAHDKIIGIKNTGAKVVMLSMGNAIIELFEYHSPTPKPLDPGQRVCDHGYTHICLEVEDIEAEYDRLKAAGMTFHGPLPKSASGMRAIYGKDPEGNVIELLELTDSDGKKWHGHIVVVWAVILWLSAPIIKSRRRPPLPRDGSGCLVPRRQTRILAFHGDT